MGDAGVFWCMRGREKSWQKSEKAPGEMSALTVRLLLTCQYLEQLLWEGALPAVPGQLISICLPQGSTQNGNHILVCAGI